MVHGAVEAVDAAAHFSGAKSASIASRGAPRTPLPSRSVKRRPRTCGHDVTNPMSGRTATDAVAGEHEFFGGPVRSASRPEIS